MPRPCPFLFATTFGLGIVLSAGAVSHALAQTAAAAAGDVFSPTIDGDARKTPRFNQNGGRQAGDGRSRFGEIPVYGNPPAVGAGQTGFDSTNSLRRKARVKAKPKPGHPPKPPLPAATTPLGAAAPAPSGDAMRLPPRFMRHGAPGVATISALNAPTTITTPRRPSPSGQDPFEPVGTTAGAFLLKPAIELTGGYDTNPAHTTVNRASSVGIVAPELLVRSDWQRHALNADLRGSYTTYGNTFSPEAPEILDRPSVDSKVLGRIDVTGRSHIDVESRFLVWTDNPGSPNVQVGLRRLPIVTTVGGTLGYTQQFNRFEVAAKGMIDRSAYQSSTLVDGSTSSNDDRDFNQYAGALRGSYDLLPGIKPFAEVGVDTRVRDIPIDRSGMQRDSNGQYAKVGTTFEFSKKLTGEISVGYLRREYTDPTLPDLGGVTADGSLIYAATPLTTLTLSARSSADEIITPGVSGVFRRDLGFQVDHAFRRWLIGSLKIGYGIDDYVGEDRLDHRYSASASVVYKLSRTVQVKGEVRRDWLRSSVDGFDWNANVVLLGVRLQR